MSRPTDVVIICMSTELLASLLKLGGKDPAAEILDVRTDIETGMVQIAVASHRALPRTEFGPQREHWCYNDWLDGGP